MFSMRVRDTENSSLSATFFPSEGHFASWLESAPRRDVSGGEVIRQKARNSNNRVATALRIAAQSLWRSDSYLAFESAPRRPKIRQGHGPLLGLPGISPPPQRARVCRSWRGSL